MNTPPVIAKACFFLFLLFLNFGAIAQNPVTDLENLLKKKLPDTARVNTLNKLATFYAATDSINTFSYAGQAIALSQKIRYSYGRALALIAEGNFFIVKNKPQDARPYLDEAITLLKEPRYDLDRAIAENHLSRALILMTKGPEAISLLQKNEKIFLSKNYLTGLSAAYNNMGVAYSDMGRKEEAITYFLKSLATDEKLHNEKQAPLTLNNIGKLLYEIKSNEQARYYFEQCIEKCRAVNDMITLGKAQLNIGNTWVNDNDYGKAVQYFDQAATTFEKAAFKRGTMTCRNNIGALYIRQQKYEQAIPPLKQALSLAIEMQLPSSIALTQQNIGYNYIFLKQYEEAKSWFLKAEALAAKGLDQYTTGEIYNHRAVLDSAMGDYQSAYTYKTKYQQIAEKTLNERVTGQVAELQIKYETEKKEHRIALLNKDNAIQSLHIQNQKLELDRSLYDLSQKELMLSQDKLRLADNQLEIDNKNNIILQQQLDSTQKAKHIQDLNKQTRIQMLEIQNRGLQTARSNMIIMMLGGLLVVFLLLGYSYYRRYRLKQQARLQSEIVKQQELATKAVLEAEEAERQRIAKDLHDGVGQMMSAAKMNLSAYEHGITFATAEERHNFDKIVQLVDDSCKEVRSVSHNMMPNALLKNSLAAAIREFIDKLDHKSLQVHLYTEGLDVRLASDVETVLYRVIQECVNNVIKHAEANVLDISIIKEAAEISATIEDNGKGFDATDSSRFEGIGLKNIRTRIEYLKGDVTFESTPGKGTLVVLHIPLTQQ